MLDWTGGNAEAALRRAQRMGDGRCSWSRPDEAMPQAVERLQGQATEAGRDSGVTNLGPQLNVGWGDPDGWRAFALDRLEFGATRPCWAQWAKALPPRAATSRR